jgi:putative transposase
MPRRARCYLPGFPYHIVQRGNNREACFIEPENYETYLELWKEAVRRYGVKVHAYCLMTNHIHFLATPETETGLSNTSRVVGSRYAQYINKRYRRTGTLWEGRHRSSLIQQDEYLLACYRYIELNPVRAGMVSRPEEYPWSSYGANAWGDKSWVIPHDVFQALADEPGIRREMYRGLFATKLREESLSLFRKATHYCQPVGDDRFRLQIEANYGIKLGQMARGRPRKSPDDDLYKK